MNKTIWILAVLLAAGICEAKDQFEQEIRGALQGSAFYSHSSGVRGADELYLGYGADGRLVSAVAIGRIRSSTQVTALIRVRRQADGYAIDQAEILDLDKIKEDSRRQGLRNMASTLRGSVVQDGSGKKRPLDAVSGATASRKNVLEDFDKLAKTAAETMAANPPWPKVPMPR